MTRTDPILRILWLGGVLALAVGALIAATSPAHSNADVSPNASAAAGRAVTIRNFTFRPRTLVVARGTTVRWSNHDSTNHTITADHGSLGISNLRSGRSATIRFTHAGTFRYHCSFHPFMHGTIVIR